MVSIVIPCYNLASYLPTTINSIKNQKDEDWEVIAVDDGSTDSTLEVLKSYERSDRRINVLHQENQGVSAARNNGIQIAKGDWIYFLDGDDIVSPDLVSMLNSIPPDINFTFFDFLIEDYKGIHKIYRQNSSDNILSHFLTNAITICMCSFAVRTNYVKDNDIMFDNKTFYGEDREFIAKVLSFQPKIEKINKILFRYQLREGSAMANKIYSERRFSSVLASERTYLSLTGTPEEKDAHTNLSFTIARHLKMYYDYNCQDTDLLERLWQYAEKYIKAHRGWGLGKVEIYTALVRLLYKNKTLFKLFLKLY